MAIANLYPTVQPSLSLDFANVKALDPRITFSRASTARYYDGVTVAKAEENLILYSQEFDNSYWAKTRATVAANATTAPDGTSTADALLETDTTGTHIIQNSSTTFATVAGQLVVSVFAKPNGRDWIRLNGDTPAGTNGFAEVFFDVNNGVVGTSASGNGWTVASSSITAVIDGWFRCVVVINTTARTDGKMTVFLASADGTASYAGDVTKGVYLWGAQAEIRSAVTAYTATTTQPITNYIPVLLTANNNVARFDHNPTTGESLGLLVEEQRTNLVLRSEEFDNASWTKGRSSITANTIVAPDGTLTGDRLVEDTTATNSHLASQTVTCTAAAHTFSVYAKRGERNGVALRFVDPTFTVAAAAWFNLDTGATYYTFGTLTASSVSVGNGWYRVSITHTLASSGSWAVSVAIGNTSVSATAFEFPSYTGDGYSGIFLWGAQLEAGAAGAFPTSYIPTTSASATRAFDSAQMTGANFTSWFSNAEGTVYTEVTPTVLGAGTGVTIDDNTNNNRLRIGATSTSDQMTVTTGGTAQAVLDGGTPVAGSTMKIAAAYKVNDFALSLDGGAVATDTSGTVPVVTQMGIGKTVSTEGNVRIRKVAFYPARLTNAQLQALTT
jgi:hypothetical protein